MRANLCPSTDERFYRLVKLGRRRFTRRSRWPGNHWSRLCYCALWSNSISLVYHNCIPAKSAVTCGSENTHPDGKLEQPAPSEWTDTEQPQTQPQSAESPANNEPRRRVLIKARQPSLVKTQISSYSLVYWDFGKNAFTSVRCAWPPCNPAWWQSPRERSSSERTPCSSLTPGLAFN